MTAGLQYHVWIALTHARHTNGIRTLGLGIVRTVSSSAAMFPQTPVGGVRGTTKPVSTVRRVKVCLVRADEWTL